MFKFLEGQNLNDVATASHHAIQVTRRQWVAAQTKDYLATANDPELTPLQADLVKRIIGEIESREGASINELPTKKLDKYIKQLSERVIQISTEQLPSNPAKGRRLLNKLRSTDS